VSLWLFTRNPVFIAVPFCPAIHTSVQNAAAETRLSTAAPHACVKYTGRKRFAPVAAGLFTYCAQNVWKKHLYRTRATIAAKVFWFNAKTPGAAAPSFLKISSVRHAEKN